MRFYAWRWRERRARETGYTLVEVVTSIAVATLCFAGVLYGYVLNANQADWSACSLAAHSFAMQAVEQARAAQWSPAEGGDAMGTTNYTWIGPLDVPSTGGSPLYATNYVAVTTYSTSPPIRQLRADCVWRLPNRPAGRGGPFTTTVVTPRPDDQ
jgi:hypothetical protein